VGAFDQRDREGTEWVVLRTASDLSGTIADLLPQSDLSRISQSLATGHVVVAATEPRLRGDEPFVDWWQVAEDGTTLGMGFRGWGTEVTEQVGVHQVPFKVFKPQKKMMKDVACAAVPLVRKAHIDDLVFAGTDAMITVPSAVLRAAAAACR
jgi:hypothetical protein